MITPADAVVSWYSSGYPISSMIGVLVVVGLVGAGLRWLREAGRGV